MDVPDLGEVMEAFATAVGIMLRESAMVESGLRSVAAHELPRTGEGLSAALTLESARVDLVVLCLPAETALALAERVLAGVPLGAIDETMVRDCAGEMVNVTAGQAKALLSGSADRLTFSTPRVYAGPGQPLREGKGAWCQVAEFVCEVGEFSLRLYVC